MVRRNRSILVERERHKDAIEYEKTLQEKQKLMERKRQKPISVRLDCVVQPLVVISVTC